MPFVGPLLLHSGIARASRTQYAELLEKENLDSKEALVDVDPLKLMNMGIPVADAKLLLASFKALHMPSSSDVNELVSDVSALSVSSSG
jgi:hypothetical protein